MKTQGVEAFRIGKNVVCGDYLKIANALDVAACRHPYQARYVWIPDRLDEYVVAKSMNAQSNL